MRKSRAVFLSAGGDPFIATLVMRLWKERWYDEIDKFYVCYNNHADVPLDVAQEFIALAMTDPKVQIIYHPEGVGNGTPITEMALIAKEDLVLLLEDDGFIFDSGEVNVAFKLIEEGAADAVGSPRGSCGQEVTDAMIKKYNIDISGLGDKGVNYWPNFFFCKREDLLKTDLNMASKHFPKGEYFKELDHTFTEDNYGDTFVWADIQMRYNGVRFGEVPQYHASPEEIDYHEAKQDKWVDGLNIGWIHGGSLSSGLSGYLSGSLPDVSTESAKLEIETRCAFWQIAIDTTEGYSIFKSVYEKGLADLILGANLSPDRVHKKYNIYRNLLQL
mgnify:CR=1 FL=1